jgi:hypothetical protein
LLSFHQPPGDIGGDNPVAPLPRFAYNDNHDVLAPSQAGVPSRKQLGISHPFAAADLVRIGKGFSDSIPVFGKKIGMVLGDVPLSRFGQFDFSIQIGTGKPGRHLDLSSLYVEEIYADFRENASSV